MTTINSTVSHLIKKYNQPVPRYTSYPAVPNWKNDMSIESWKDIFTTRFNEQNAVNSISIYIHLPFCESLCLYCGCDKKITASHSVEASYLELIQKEWSLYRSLMKETPVIRELHLGGGTPAFFPPQNLERLIEVLVKDSILHPQYNFSMEGHPNNTTTGHLAMLYRQGFRRISFGVQDTDPEVQRLINRLQPIEKVAAVTQEARRIGFTSVNFDLIYGLPAQTPLTIAKTIEQSIELEPDRIAFYSYAHTPWANKAQRGFDNYPMPDADEKLELYITGKKLLLQAGYEDIGMDHFSLPEDSLYKAKQAGSLHRNFMGHTQNVPGLLLGLGVSSISDGGYGFAQNEKTIGRYAAAINGGELAIAKGHILSEEDCVFGQYILDLICRGQAKVDQRYLSQFENAVFPRLMALQQDGLIEWSGREVKITKQGGFFIRNICAAFDLYLQRTVAPEVRNVYSKAI